MSSPSVILHMLFFCSLLLTLSQRYAHAHIHSSIPSVPHNWENYSLVEYYLRVIVVGPQRFSLIDFTFERMVRCLGQSNECTSTDCGVRVCLSGTHWSNIITSTALALHCERACDWWFQVIFGAVYTFFFLAVPGRMWNIRCHTNAQAVDEWPQHQSHIDIVVVDWFPSCPSARPQPLYICFVKSTVGRFIDQPVQWVVVFFSLSLSVEMKKKNKYTRLMRSYATIEGKHEYVAVNCGSLMPPCVYAKRNVASNYNSVCVCSSPVILRDSFFSLSWVEAIRVSFPPLAVVSVA